MDTIPEGTVERLRDEAIAEIIRTKARDMYRHEYLAMAVELRELRAERSKLLAAEAPYDITAGKAKEWIAQLMWPQMMGHTVWIPDITRGVKYGITKENW